MNQRLINAQRRDLIKKTISASTLAMVAASGLILPQRVLAHWPKDAFTAETVEDVLLALLGRTETTEDHMLNFSVGKPPVHAVDGQSVPVEIYSELENIERLAILVDNNPFPLVMSFELSRNVLLPFKTRIKVAEGESKIIVVASSAGGPLYMITHDIKVDTGGNA
tara:strand:- start:766 stop:1263 length:498 start_codon:yes stop_codon:yes gene_type:complete